MQPITMLRNALGREEGGSGVPLNKGAYQRCEMMLSLSAGSSAFMLRFSEMANPSPALGIRQAYIPRAEILIRISGWLMRKA
jgi:hypothetical protein